MDYKQSGIISIQNPNSPITEAYKTLRTNIKFSSVDKSLKKIAITSTGQGEGKSTIASNLATVIALDSSKVLLIDCDLRRPTIHKKFALSNLSGLSNVLTQQNTIDEVIQKTDILGMDVITSGPKPPNPSEMLGSNAMKELLKEFSKVYDMIIVDVPPVGIVTDAAVLTTMVDGVLLIVESSKVSIEAARHAKKLLEGVNATILGVVLNKVSTKDRGYYSYKQYQQYHEEVDVVKKTKKRKLKK